MTRAHNRPVAPARATKPPRRTRPTAIRRDRITAIRASRLTRPLVPALPWPAPARPVAVGAALARVHQAQRRLPAQIGRLWRRRPVRRVALLAPPLTLLALLLLLAGPILYQGARAYQSVFVPPVTHRPYPLLPAAAGNATDPALPAAPAAPPAPAPSPWDGTEPLTLLLLGIDRRADEPARTDTMILVWVDPVARQAALLSLPRDLKVIVPGHGFQKINAAFTYGEQAGGLEAGAALTIQTIEANFGIRVDHFALIDFAGFVALVDLAGGVTVDIPAPIVDEAYPTADYGYTTISFPAGRHQLDGERALQYARTRHADGDLLRAARQQQILLALRDQASFSALLPRAGEILTVLGDSLRTDLSLDQTLRLARLAEAIPVEAITSFSLSDALTIEDPDGVYYLVPDWTATGAILSAFTRTTVVPPAAALANIDRTIPIRVENGTLNDGLAVRVGEFLIASGFTDVIYEPAPDPGTHPTTTIVDRSGDLATAAYVAALIGIDPGSVAVQPRAGAATPAAGDARERGIVIVLGDDAPEPATGAPPG